MHFFEENGNRRAISLKFLLRDRKVSLLLSYNEKRLTILDKKCSCAIRY